MLGLNSSFKVNEPDVIAESVDGEVLIINLNSGAYYSSDGSGDLIWTLVASGAQLGEVVTRLGALYPASVAGIEPAVLDFARQLAEEGLVVAAAAEIAPGSGAEIEVSPGSVFAAPVLSKYTDFQELLLLDPIHEVDTSVGWPLAKPAD